MGSSYSLLDVIVNVEVLSGRLWWTVGFLCGEEAVVGGDKILEVVEGQQTRSIHTDQKHKQLTHLHQFSKFLCKVLLLDYLYYHSQRLLKQITGWGCV